MINEDQRIRKNILITGATGLIGRYAVRKMLEENQHVLALVHTDHGLDRHDSLEIKQADLTSIKQLEELTGPQRIDAIVHCAALVPKSPADEARVYTYNQKIDGLILSYLQKHRHTGLVYLSGSSLYDVRSNAFPINEEGRLVANGTYLQSKIDSEKKFLELENPKTILRVSSPYGRYQKNTTVLKKFIEQVLKGEDIVYYGNGERSQDFIHGSDVASAIYQSIARNCPEPVLNIVSAQAVTMKELAQLVKAAHPGSPTRVLSHPAPEGMDESYKGIFDNGRARTALGWEPKITLEQGVSDWINEMIKHP